MYYYDEPQLKTVNITDLFDSSLNYTVLKYATKISNNNFTRNFAGMKGSALAIFKLSELQIADNLFVENGPVTSYSEIMFSPYYKYFALGGKTLSFNLPKTELC